mmetsp:Transcript_16787/g.25232  ORF Transcript_16787/g.25232 Transcript_16787/m.25232 type:complete len:518 (+) Transcript_16787:161-1714(+)|eukprot:CAMPEP_0185019516 /NCGR_PEP_ID=MMETSP1103-20130426/2120_1 /TAXON_ID=36769 /ORGANISM="Paraphysomonas bandaiensis, Strain Caron Lab Isolate" /LENGTH=517 /DNA_ID=CAMNT_0027549875 /DNA_START=108 /DNA_END=1661 /DNA_ORIENTATION=+
MADYPHPPIQYKEMRERIRTGLPCNEARQLWWPILVKTGYHQSVDQVPDIPGLARKRWTWALQSLHGNDDPVDVNLEWNEMEEGEVAKEVMQMLIRQYHMPEPGLVASLVRTLSAVLSNRAILFSTCCDIMGRPGWFISPEPASHRLKLFTFRELGKRIIPQTYSQLDAIGALTDTYLNIILVDMMAPVLTPEQCNKVLDAYLIDGVKTLYRYGLGLFKMFKDQIKKKVYKTGEQFWSAMRAYHLGGIDFQQLSDLSLDNHRSVFQRSTVPPRTKLAAIELKAREALGETLREPLGLDYDPAMIGESSSTGNEGINPSDSLILDSTACSTLNSFLPPSTRMEGMDLTFSTYNDGWSFFNLYEMVEHLSPCVILLRTVETDAILGMYMSTPIAPPSMDVRGDGQCFCFRLDGPNAAKFPWTSPEEKIGSSTLVTATQFAHCTPTYMAFGGSNQHGTNALRIDSDLSQASSGPSDTYDNPPLAPEEPRQPFQVQNVEVFCGRSSMAKHGRSKSVPRKDR